MIKKSYNVIFKHISQLEKCKFFKSTILVNPLLLHRTDYQAISKKKKMKKRMNEKEMRMLKHR